MRAEESLQRLAATIRTDIAPAVGDEYARTQAHMAAVVLERVGRQVALGPAHAEAERADVAALLGALTPVVADGPAPVAEALATLGAERTIAALGPLIEALYRWGPDRAPVEEALALIRPALRRDIDRRMEIAR